MDRCFAVGWDRFKSAYILPLDGRVGNAHVEGVMRGSCFERVVQSVLQLSLDEYSESWVF